MPQLTVATIVMKDSASVLIGRAKDGPDAGMWVIPSDFVAEGEQVIWDALESAYADLKTGGAT